MQRRQMLGILGAFALAVGAFAPVVSLASVGGITYFRSGNGIMLALALISLAIALRNYCAWLLPAGLTALAMIITTVRTARSLLMVPGSPGAAAAGGPVPVQLDWGLAVLLFGALLLFASALLRPRSPAGAPAEPHLPRLVLVTTFVIAAVLMGVVLLWPTGTFILLER